MLMIHLCPKCRGRTFLAFNRAGEFYRCRQWPECTGTIPMKTAFLAEKIEDIKLKKATAAILALRSN